MKTAIITANLGGLDEVYGMPRQKLDCDFYYYFLNNIPVPLPNLDNRTKSKYLKIQSSRYIGHDIHIWMDGRHQIVSKTFSAIMAQMLVGYDVVMFKHSERSNPYEEIDYITENIKKGSHYLLTRYGSQQIEKEKEFLLKQGVPKDFQLYHCALFARNNNPRVNEAFNEWWRLVTEFSNFDQALFSYVAWKYDLKINSQPIKDIDKIIKYHKHKLA